MTSPSVARLDVVIHQRIQEDKNCIDGAVLADFDRKFF